VSTHNLKIQQPWFVLVTVEDTPYMKVRLGDRMAVWLLYEED